MTLAPLNPRQKERTVREVEAGIGDDRQAHIDDALEEARRRDPPSEFNTNRDRARWAEHALARFVHRMEGRSLGSLDPGEELQMLSDLIADLGHYARLHQLDFYEALGQALFHLAHESNYEWDEFVP